MDPLNVLPEELMDLIWIRIPFNDLLTCMEVCRSWRESAKRCVKVWRPLCHNLGLLNNHTTTNNNSISWYLTFMEDAKYRWLWLMGALSEDVTFQVYCQHFSCNEDYVFIINDECELCKYNKFGENLKKIRLQTKKCTQICCIGAEVVILLKCKEWNEVKIFDGELIEMKTFCTKDKHIQTANGQLWTWDLVNDGKLVSIFKAQDNEQKFCVKHMAVPFGTILTPLELGWYSIYKRKVHWIAADERWEKMYTSYGSPMAYPTLKIFSDHKDIVALMSEKVVEGRYAYSTVHIYRNNIKLHKFYFSTLFPYCCFTGGDMLVLANTKDVIPINISNGLFGRNMREGEVTPVRGIHDILNNPRRSIILVAKDHNCLVLDAKYDNCINIIKNYDVPIKLVVNKKMLVYQTEYKRLKVKYIVPQ